MSNNYQPGTYIEAELARAFSAGRDSSDFFGVPVNVVQIDRLAPRIFETAQPPFHSPYETDLTRKKPKYSINGTIQALDYEHDTLWLRPQRFTLTLMGNGYIAVVGFMQSEPTAYSVMVREQGVRDKFPGMLASPILADVRRKAYLEGVTPNLLPEQWAKIGIL